MQELQFRDGRLEGVRWPVQCTALRITTFGAEVVIQ